MGFFTNIFSGKSYTQTSSTIISEDGDVFVKAGSQWMNEDGDLIQKQSNDWVNIETGVRSSYGDPFSKEEW